MKPPPPPSTSNCNCAAKPQPGANLTINIIPSCGGETSNNSSDASGLLPDAQLALRLWTTYINQVDPVLKILHIPTTHSTIIATVLEPKSATPSQLALVFAICFAAVTSFDGRETADLAPDDSRVLLGRFKTGLNQALMQADFLNRPELLALQALAIFVV